MIASLIIPDKDDRALEDGRAVILILLQELRNQVPRFRDNPHLLTTLTSVRRANEWLAKYNSGTG